MTPTRYLHELTPAKVLPIIKAVPFFRAVVQEDMEQFKVILKFTKIFEVKPAEVIMNKGDFDSWFYFVMKGNLLIFADKVEGKPLGRIVPGEMVGEMALLGGLERSATVVGDPKSPKIMLLGTDFSPFGSLEDTSKITTHTKLAFFKGLIDILLQKLRKYKNLYPNKESLDELQYVNSQVEDLIELVTKSGQKLNDIQKNATVQKSPLIPAISEEQEKKAKEIDKLLSQIID